MNKGMIALLVAGIGCVALGVAVLYRTYNNNKRDGDVGVAEPERDEEYEQAVIECAKVARVVFDGRDAPQLESKLIAAKQRKLKKCIKASQDALRSEASIAARNKAIRELEECYIGVLKKADDTRMLIDGGRGEAAVNLTAFHFTTQDFMRMCMELAAEDGQKTGDVS